MAGILKMNSELKLGCLPSQPVAPSLFILWVCKHRLELGILTIVGEGCEFWGTVKWAATLCVFGFFKWIAVSCSSS